MEICENWFPLTHFGPIFMARRSLLRGDELNRTSVKLPLCTSTCKSSRGHWIRVCYPPPSSLSRPWLGCGEMDRRRLCTSTVFSLQARTRKYKFRTKQKKSAPYQQCFKVLFLSLRHHWGAYISATGVQTGTLWNRGWHGERGRAHEFLHQWPARSFQPDGDALPDSWPAELWLRHGWHTQR